VVVPQYEEERLEVDGQEAAGQQHLEVGLLWEEVILVVGDQEADHGECTWERRGVDRLSLMLQGVGLAWDYLVPFQDLQVLGV